MAEQSHREEMSEAIRAQRERRAVPRTIAAEAQPAAAAEPEPKAPQQKSFLGRLREKR